MKLGTKTKKEALTLVEHLSELRWRIITCLVTLSAGTCVGFAYAERILAAILTIPGHLVFLAPGEAFYTHLRVAVWTGMLLSFPMVLYQVSAFILPGLSKEEKRFLFLGMPLSALLFCAGLLFAYKVMVPFTYYFFLGFGSERLTAQISVGNYLSFVLGLILPFGAVFQLPLLTLLLTGAGLLTPFFLRRHRKYAILIIFIAAALLTPPDVITQVLMAGPLLLLYEASIIISGFVFKRRHAGLPPDK